MQQVTVTYRNAAMQQVTVTYRNAAGDSHPTVAGASPSGGSKGSILFLFYAC
jgi:hypothetical protein